MVIGILGSRKWVEVWKLVGVKMWRGMVDMFKRGIED